MTTQTPGASQPASGASSSTASAASTETPAAAAGATETKPAETTPTAQPGATAEAKPGEGGEKPGEVKEGSKAEGAPEKYEFKSTVEGVDLDADLLGEFEPLARADNLSQEKAQKYIDLGVKIAQKMLKAQADNVTELSASWAELSKADKEFGGDKLQENLGVATKAMTAFGTPELKRLMIDTGLGNHPEMIRAWLKVGKAMSDDGFVRGTTKPADQGKPFYSNSNMVR